MYNKTKKLPWITRLKLLFVRREVIWDQEEQAVTILKRMGGVVYLLHQEPFAYGDNRNEQLSRLRL